MTLLRSGDELPREGASMDAGRLHVLAARWYGDRLDPDWSPRTGSRVRALRVALEERGVTAEEMDRLSGPIGLDLGARTPEETAISIAAEIIGQRWGGSGAKLRTTEGAIHREPTTA